MLGFFRTIAPPISPRLRSVLRNNLRAVPSRQDRKFVRAFSWSFHQLRPELRPVDCNPRAAIAKIRALRANSIEYRNDSSPRPGLAAVDRLFGFGLQSLPGRRPARKFLATTSP